ncbi:MAG: SPOR domain-containing protein [Comamonas sp.]
MLRFVLLILIIANAGYFAWAQGWMATLGWAPSTESEPYRLQQQVRPDVLSVRPLSTPPAGETAEPAAQASPGAVAVAEPSSAAAAVLAAVQSLNAAGTDPLAPGSTTSAPEVQLCLQTDNIDENQYQKVRQALLASDIPANAWQAQPTAITGRWMVYLGKFANEAALERRRAELRSRKISYDRAGGNLDPGLSLGRFSTEEAASREMARLAREGIRGVRVVQERAPQTLYVLRFAQVTETQRRVIQALHPALSGSSLRNCVRP